MTSGADRDKEGEDHGSDLIRFDSNTGTPLASPRGFSKGVTVHEKRRFWGDDNSLDDDNGECLLELCDLFPMQWLTRKHSYSTSKFKYYRKCCCNHNFTGLFMIITMLR